MSSTPQAAWRARGRSRRALAGVGCALAMCVAAAPAQADGSWHHSDHGSRVIPGSLLLSTSEYVAAHIIPGVTQLPPGCAGTTASPCAPAIADGTYPYVFNNDTVDGSFGITSPIVLDELTPWGQVFGRIPVPSRDAVTSFSSKSELALNLSTNGQDLTFMGYDAPVGALDVSNSNTPGVVDPTNPVTGAYYREVADLGRDGWGSFTLTNAYSGNNGRAAILNNAANAFYTAGNAGNGSNPQPDGVIIGAGAQILSRSFWPQWLQSPGTPTPVGSFNITQLGNKPDKIGKDTNFRGLTIYNNVVYYTKGSGGNGVNTVYFIDTTGKACPSTSATPGVGLPEPGAALPTSPIAYNTDHTVLQSQGVVPYNMCILKGFPTALKSTTSFPFGVWFANPTTLYVADEGSADNTYSAASNTYTVAAAQTTAGLQKWVFNQAAGEWQRAYTLQNGLNLGQPYTVPGYPTGNNAVGGLPWAPATDGLRNLTGHVGRNGTATIWAITSTVSGSGDQGADPNKLVAVTDQLSATTLPGSETFGTVKAARSGEVLRGVSFAPATESDSDH
jgi:hypothetical protein